MSILSKEERLAVVVELINKSDKWQSLETLGLQLGWDKKTVERYAQNAFYNGLIEAKYDVRRLTHFRKKKEVSGK